MEEKVKAFIHQLRTDYAMQQMDEKSILRDPFKQFEKWMEEVIQSEIMEPNAFTLSSVSPSGKPSGRIVLMRSFDKEGFVFFTNYNSRKGQELIHGSFAAMTFFWPQLQRQVRVEGTVKKLAENLSDEYFASRPKNSQIGAWASPQSSVLVNRLELDQKEQALQEQYKNKTVPRPPHWGGFIIQASSIEFWQGRPSRLHDRILFTSTPNNDWKIQRLAP